MSKRSFCLLDTAPLSVNTFRGPILNLGLFDDFRVKPIPDPREDKCANPFDLPSVQPKTADELFELALGCESVGLNKTILTEDQVVELHAAGTRHYFVAAIGTDNLPVKQIVELGGTVCNVPEYCTPDVAEQTMALIFDLSRGNTANDRAVAAGKWQETGYFSFATKRSRRVAGLTLGLIGAGRIGSEVARLAQANGMKVIAFDQYAQDRMPCHPFLDWRSCAEEVYSEADIISLHTPGQPGGKALLDWNQFRVISDAGRKPDLINTSRGDNINTSALVSALSQGWVQCAALDVQRKGQEPPTDPVLLLQIERLRDYGCIILPHTSWFTEESVVEMVIVFNNNIAYMYQGSPQNQVLPQAA